MGAATETRAEAATSADGITLVLMYHSIAKGDGPAFVPPATLRTHLGALEAAAYTPISLDQLAEAMAGGAPLPARTFALTFDDGYADFADAAAPAILERGWPATVYVPPGRVGGTSDWTTAGRTGPVLPLMSWEQIEALAADGIDFGSHGLTHADLTRIPEAEVRRELEESRRVLEDRVGRPVAHMAYPYGAVDATARRIATATYDTAAGTHLDRVVPDSDPADLPRLEMWYFRDPERWRRFLEGRAEAWFALRRGLRSLRARLRGGP